MLGFILAPLGQKVAGQYPNEINYAYGGAGAYLEPADPQFNTRGEPGFYYDTPLGGLKGPAIPTDAELAKNYGYTPVQAGWINAKEGFFPGPWRTPGGWNPAGAYGPPKSLSGVGFNMTTPTFIGIVVVAGLLAWGYSKRDSVGKRERAASNEKSRRNREYEAARRRYELQNERGA